MRSTPESSGCQTACLLILCRSSDSSHYWLIVDRHPTTRPLCSVPITGTSPLLRGVPPSWRATGTPPLTVFTACGSPSRYPLQPSGSLFHAEEFSCSVVKPGPSSRHLHAGHRQTNRQAPV